MRRCWASWPRSTSRSCTSRSTGGGRCISRRRSSSRGRARCRGASSPRCSSTSPPWRCWAPISSRAAPASWRTKPRPPPDAGQLGLRGRRVRSGRRRVRRLLGVARPEGAGAGGVETDRAATANERPAVRSGLAGHTPMKPKFIVGGVVIALALGYMIWAGVSQSVVYFVTPSELSAAPVSGKAYRLGGLVERGSLTWEPKTLDLTFKISDGKMSVPVRHHGAPPDRFGEGRGAVVEGQWMSDGYFKASLIMAKHSEEYKAPHDVKEAQDPRLIKTLEGGKQ